MTIAVFVHLTNVKFSRGTHTVTKDGVFVREIVMKMLIALQGYTVSSWEILTWCLGAKARGQGAGTIAFPKQPYHLRER